MTATETATEARKHITQQWFEFDVFQALEKTSQLRPDLEVKVLAIERSDNMVLTRLTFTNVGKTIYVRRLVHFIVEATTKNMKR